MSRVSADISEMIYLTLDVLLLLFVCLVFNITNETRMSTITLTMYGGLDQRIKQGNRN